MTGFIKLTRSEGGNVRTEWINVEAIDNFAGLEAGNTFIRLRHGGSIYVSESVDQILQLIQ